MPNMSKITSDVPLPIAVFVDYKDQAVGTSFFAILKNYSTFAMTIQLHAMTAKLYAKSYEKERWMDVTSLYSLADPIVADTTIEQSSPTYKYFKLVWMPTGVNNAILATVTNLAAAKKEVQ